MARVSAALDPGYSGGGINRKMTKETWSINRKQGRYLRVITASGAKQVLASDQRKNKFPRSKKDYLTTVDYKIGVPEEQVKFGGRIKYHNNQSSIAEVLAWIAAQLVRNSPYRTKRPQDNSGFRAVHYEDSHLYMVDGRSAMTLDNVTNIVALRQTFQTRKHSAGSEFMFVNPMPYARRIEHGGGFTHTTKDRLYKKGKKKGQVKKGKTRTLEWSMQAPNGVYKMIAREAKRKFGLSVNITYARFQLNTGYQIFNRKKKLVGQWYPSIVIRPKKNITKGLTK